MTAPAAPDILIVDDTPANLQLLAGMLKERGYKARPAPNGRVALQAAQSQPPDLILLDINMPEMNGYEVCTQLKASEQLRDIPVIFISALDETIDKVCAFSVGAVDYITKPFQFEEVEARVGAHLRLRHLQLELEARNHELQNANDELRRLQTLRDNLTHMIVHDMRSPLGGIVGYHDLLRKHDNSNLSERGAEFLRKASESSDRLIGMVNSLLDVSKLEAGELKPQRMACDLGALAREAAEMLSSLARNCTLEVIPPAEPIIVPADRDLIFRVLQNLISNALKFTPAGGQVQVSMELEGPTALVSVRDTGSGIAPENHARIFEKFGQVNQRGPRIGTGLGLTFCRLAVQAHGGEIGVESALGEGSRFWFRLPTRVG